MAGTTSYRLAAASHALSVAGAPVRARLPDVAAIAALATFLYTLFVFQGPTRLFHDSDAGWHIRSGEQILRTLRLPTADPYSFSRAGQAWMNWEWLSDIASGAAHQAAGLGGVALLFSAAIALAVWGWFELHWKLGTHFLLAGLLAVPMLGTVHLHWLARPHVFSWLLMLGALWWAESDRTPRRLALYTALAALWANVHASFLFAPFLASVYAVSRFLRPLIWKLDRRDEWAAARYYLAAAGLAALAGLVNPYGWQLHRHVLAYLADSELLASVGEFQSFNFHGAGAGQILLALVIAVAGTAAALASRRLDHFLLGVVLLASALYSARGLPLVALLLLPIAGAHLSELWRACAQSDSIQPALRRVLDAAWRYGVELRRLDRTRASGLWTVPLLVAACAASAPLLATRASFPAAEFPVAAAARLEQLAPELFDAAGPPWSGSHPTPLPGEARLLAPDKFGGYLIYRFDGRLKVFFDGRSDFYGASFLRDWRNLVQVRSGWQDQITRYGFTHALLPNDYSLVDALQRAGWTVLYRDRTVTLLKCRA